MKNVKVILISCALFATIFANARIDALGGDAGFWPGDRANLDAFPQTVNDLGFVEIDGVDNLDGTEGATASSSIVFGDATKWGFSWANNTSYTNFEGDDLENETDNNPWFNIRWGNGDMGLSVAYISNDDGAEGDVEDDESGFSVSWGQNMSFGELGVHFSSTTNTCATGCDQSSYGVNWRGAMDAWVFDNAKANLSMSSISAGDTDWDHTELGFDLFTHMDVASGATVLLGMGFDYNSWSLGDADATMMTLPAATVAVEAGLTDWATLRAFATHSYTLSCDNDGATTDCSDGESGVGATDYGFGLGFDWGAVALDMEVGNSLFTDPVSTITGYGTTDAGTTNNLATGNVTLSYSF